MVHLIVNDVDIDVHLHWRLLKFVNLCVNNKNKIVVLCSEVGCEPVHTTRELVPTSEKF